MSQPFWRGNIHLLLLLHESGNSLFLFIWPLWNTLKDFIRLHKDVQTSTRHPIIAVFTQQNGFFLRPVYFCEWQQRHRRFGCCSAAYNMEKFGVFFLFFVVFFFNVFSQFWSRFCNFIDRKWWKIKAAWRSELNRSALIFYMSLKNIKMHEQGHCWHLYIFPRLHFLSVLQRK